MKNNNSMDITTDYNFAVENLIQFKDVIIFNNKFLFKSSKRTVLISSTILDLISQQFTVSTCEWKTIITIEV